MASNGPNIRLVCLAAANAPPSSSCVRMAAKGVLAPALADSTIGSRRCGRAAGHREQSLQRPARARDEAWHGTSCVCGEALWRRGGRGMQGRQRRQPWALAWLVLMLAVPAWAQGGRGGEEEQPQPAARLQVTQT